jgi:CheY-like chemotaxis protein
MPIINGIEFLQAVKKDERLRRIPVVVLTNHNPKELPVIRAAWLLPGIFVLACEREVPHVDDPDNIVVNGKEMSKTDFINKYCIGKEKDPTCSKVSDAAGTRIKDAIESRGTVVTRQFL